MMWSVYEVALRAVKIFVDIFGRVLRNMHEEVLVNCLCSTSNKVAIVSCCLLLRHSLTRSLLLIHGIVPYKLKRSNHTATQLCITSR